jgi:hypothetical protein
MSIMWRCAFEDRATAIETGIIVKTLKSTSILNKVEAACCESDKNFHDICRVRNIMWKCNVFFRNPWIRRQRIDSEEVILWRLGTSVVLERFKPQNSSNFLQVQRFELFSGSSNLREIVLLEHTAPSQTWCEPRPRQKKQVCNLESRWNNSNLHQTLGFKHPSNFCEYNKELTKKSLSKQSNFLLRLFD